MTLRESVGVVLRQIRFDKGLSLTHVAEDVGISKATLSLIESGKRGTQLDTLDSICIALGVRPSTVLRRAEKIKDGE